MPDNGSQWEEGDQTECKASIANSVDFRVSYVVRPHHPDLPFLSDSLRFSLLFLSSISVNGSLACPLMMPKNAYQVGFLTRLVDFSDNSRDSMDAEWLLKQVLDPPLTPAYQPMAISAQVQYRGLLPAYMYR